MLETYHELCQGGRFKIKFLWEYLKTKSKKDKNCSLKLEELF